MKILKQWIFDEDYDTDAMESDMNIKKLFAKRLDLIAGSSLHMPKYVNYVGRDPNDLEMAFIFKQLQLYMAFSNSTSNQIVSLVNKAFIELKKTGTFISIIEKY